MFSNFCATIGQSFWEIPWSGMNLLSMVAWMLKSIEWPKDLINVIEIGCFCIALNSIQSWECRKSKNTCRLTKHPNTIESWQPKAAEAKVRLLIEFLFDIFLWMLECWGCSFKTLRFKTLCWIADPPRPSSNAVELTKDTKVFFLLTQHCPVRCTPMRLRLHGGLHGEKLFPWICFSYMVGIYCHLCSTSFRRNVHWNAEWHVWSKAGSGDHRHWDVDSYSWARIASNTQALGRWQRTR